MRVRSIAALVLAGLAAAAGGWWWLGGEGEQTAFRLDQVTRSDVRSTVEATGNLEAVVTVEVGTQVSGIVAEILVDFNDRVEAGQVLARIDTTLLEADVRSARAALALSVAEADQSTLELERMQRLHSRQAATTQELELVRTEQRVAAARVVSSQIALERAERNLGYATVASPIDGTIIQRAVDVGQTVNAGFSAPTLFLVAGDLSHLQILARVDEADIGLIEPDQRVDFTVAAWSRDSFHGSVRQVRLDATTEDNVVTYTAVIDVDNPDGRLLPGMTATVELVVDEALDTLCVPGAALRFRPEPEQMTGEPAAAAGGEAGERGERGERGGHRGKRSDKRKGRDKSGSLWVAEGDRVRRLPVVTGLSDGTCTQVSGDGVEEGLEVVTGVERIKSNGSSPFQAPDQSERRLGGF